MRIPFRTPADERDYLEPPRSPLIPLTCLLAIAGAAAVVGFELGVRLALITTVFAAVAIVTRVPRVLPVATVVTLLIAAFAVLAGGESAPALAAHVHHIAVAHKQAAYK
jgi:hypothetical protein